MIDTSAGTAGATLQRLMKELAARRNRYDILQMYYDGENGIPAYADAAVRDAARRLMQMSRTNYAELAIEATRERMDPLGFGLENFDGIGLWRDTDDRSKRVTEPGRRHETSEFVVNSVGNPISFPTHF